MANEIDIKYVLNTREFEAESKKIEKAIDGVEIRYRKATESFKEEIELQKKFLQDLERMYNEMEKTVSNIAPGAAQSAMITELANIKVELEDERRALTLLTEKQKEYEASCVSLRIEIANVKNEMANLAAESDAYQQKMQQLVELQGKFGEVTEQDSALSGSESAYKATGEVLKGLTGAMEVGTGIADLFGASQENLEKIQIRLNAVVAISLGAQKVSQVLDKEGYLNTVLLTKAKEYMSVATTKVALALGITNVQAQILMGTLTLGLSAAITGIVLLFNKMATASAENKKKLEETAAAQQEFNTSVASSISKPLTELRRLQTEWNKLDKLADKQKFIDDNKKAFESLGVAVSSVSDADNILIKNSAAVIASLKAKAMATASMGIAADYYKKVIEANMVADNREKTITKEDMDKAYNDKAYIQLSNKVAKESNPIERNQLAKVADAALLKIAAGYAAEAAQIMRKEAGVDKYLQTIDALAETASKQNAEAKKLFQDAEITTPDTENKNNPKNRLKNKPAEDGSNNDKKVAEENYKKTSENMQHEINQAVSLSWQKRININQDGYDKELDQIELNLTREANAIAEYKNKQLQLYQDNEKNKYIAKNGTDEGFKPSKTSFTQLPQELQDFAKDWEKEVIDNHSKGQSKVFENMLSDYTTYATTYIQKVEEFEENLKNLEESGASTESITGVKQVQDDILARLDEEVGMKSDVLVSFMEKVVNMGLDELLTELDTAKTALDAEQLSGNNSENATVLKTQVKTLEAQILAQKKQAGMKSTDDPAKKWKDTLGVMNDVDNVLSGVIDSFGGMDDSTKQVLNAAMNIAKGVVSLIIGITTLAKTSAASTKVVSDGAKESIKGVEKASAIIAIISAALQVIQAIASVVTGLFNDDKKKERAIQRLQVLVDALGAAYEKLDKAIDKAYSNDAAQLIEEQESNLKKQRALIEQQMKLEEEKKDTDDGKVQGYKDAIKEIDNALGEVQDRVIEALTGTDVKSAIDGLAEAYADAWSSKGDTKEAVKETVRGFIKSAVTELIKSRIAPEVTSFMEFLANAMKDGILTQAESEILDELERKIYEKAESLDKGFDKYKEPEQENDSTLAGQIRGSVATEQSVSELGGIFRGQWDCLKGIEKVLVIDHLDKLKENILVQKQIADNTRRSADNSDTLVSGIEKIHNTLDQIDKNTKPDNGAYGY